MGPTIRGRFRRFRRLTSNYNSRYGWLPTRSSIRLAHSTLRGTEYEVMAMTGTFNGDPISYALAPSPNSSWLDVNFGVGDLTFSLDGAGGSFWYDNLFNMIEIGDPDGDGDEVLGGYTSYTATVVSTPEPSLLALQAIGLMGLGLLPLARFFLFNSPMAFPPS